MPVWWGQCSRTVRAASSRRRRPIPDRSCRRAWRDGCRLAGLLLSSLGAVSAVAAEPGADRLRHYLNDVRSWTARFEQTVLDARGRTLETARGTVAVERPARFRWDYAEPYAQSIVGDGDTVWIYDIDLAQITRHPQRDAIGASPAALLGNGTAVETRYAIIDIGMQEALAWVELRPLDPEDQYQRIRIGFGTEALAAMVLIDQLDQQTVLQFTEVTHDVAIDATRFRFVPPPGVDVIDAAAAP